MELGKLIVIILVALFVLILILFPEARALFSGFTRLFIKDMATTPEGAEAIYGEKIDQAQDAYNKADNAYKVAAGKLSNAKRDMENLKTKLSKVEAECESLVKAGKLEMAQLKAEEREEVVSDIKRYTELVKAYEDAATTYKVLNQCDEIAVIKNPLYYYFLRQDSISGNERFTEKYLDLFDALKKSNEFFLEQKKEQLASFIVPQLLKVGIYSWWGTKYILKQSKRAEEILQYIKLKSQKITATQYFYGLQKYCILLLLKFPVLYAIYRRLVPGLIGNRR